jgi:oligosaccharide repeat unit polymerase
MDGFSQVSSTPAYLLLLVVLSLIAFDCRRDVRQIVSARNVFLLTIIAWFLLEACLMPRELLKYTQSEHLLGLMGVGSAVGAFLLGYYATRGGAFDGVFRRLVTIDSPRVIWGVFLFAIFVGFLPLLVVTEGNPLPILEDAFVPKARWTGLFQRNRFGGFKDAMLELQLFLRAALPLAAAIMVQKKQSISKKCFVVIFLVFMAARALNDGTRSKMIEILLPLAAAIYWRMTPQLKKKSLLFGLPVVLTFGLLWSAASVLGRNQGRLDWEGAMEADYIGFEMFRELLFLQKLVPAHGDYQWGHTYLVQLVNPVPRFLWPNKPIGDAGLELAALQGAVQNGYTYLTVSPGLIGEMYWNGGFPGILFISAFFGYLARSWDRARPLAAQSILAFTVFAAGLAIIFVSGRSINMNTAYGMLGLYSLLMLFSRGPARREQRVLKPAGMSISSRP